MSAVSADARATDLSCPTVPGLEQHSRRLDGKARLLVIGLFILTSIYFLPLFDEDANARLDTTIALIQHHSLNIDAYRSNTGDVALYQGHYHAIQAPGQALVGVPFALAFKSSLSRHQAANIGIGRKKGFVDFFFLLYLEGIVTTTLPAAFVLALLWWFLGYFTASTGRKALVTLGFAFATSFFPFSRVFYSHVNATGLLFVAFCLLYVVSSGPGAVRGPWTERFFRNPLPALFLAGLCMGLAEVFEYPSAVIIACILFYGLIKLPLRLCLLIVVGCLPGLAIVLGYNFEAYHSLLHTGYSGYSVRYKTAYSGGFAGLKFPPSPSALWGTSLSPYRGLFFTSPYLLLAIPGYVAWFAKRGRDSLVFLVIPVIYFLAMAMYPIWWAGNSVGPRLLIPVLPFLSLAVVFALENARSTWQRACIYLLFLLSFLITWCESLGGLKGYPSAKDVNPLFNYSLPGVLHGHVTPSLGSAIMGPSFGSRSLATLLPLLFLLLVWTLVVGRHLVGPFFRRAPQAARASAS